jgi:hypothetical protein
MHIPMLSHVGGTAFYILATQIMTLVTFCQVQKDHKFYSKSNFHFNIKVRTSLDLLKKEHDPY